MSRRIILILFAALATNAASASGHSNLPQCSVATLQGQYIFAGEGIIEAVEPGVQRVHYGTFIFDGSGRLSGKQSSSRGGRIGREVLEGTYQLDRDCSGSITLRFVGRSETETHWDMYATSNGHLGHMVRMDEGSMAVRTFRK